MAVKPINDSVEEHFTKIYLEAQAEGMRQYKENIEHKFLKLSHYQQMELLVNEFLRLDEIENNSDYPFYINYHNHQDKLLNQFASRRYLLNVDESKELSDCIKIGRLKTEVDTHINILQRSIPDYTFGDFISGKVDLYFANWGMSPLLREENINRIRAWQEAAVIDIANYESVLLIKKMQIHCAKITEPIKFLKAEWHKITEELKNTTPDFPAITKSLSNLFVLQKHDFKKWDQERLIECFNQFKEGNIDYKFVNPHFINPIIKRIEAKTKSIISSEVTIFFTLIKITHWLDSVVRENNWDRPISAIDWRKQFDSMLLDAQEEIVAEKDKIKEFLEDSKDSKEEVKKYLTRQFHLYRSRFNSFQYKYYFEHFGSSKTNEFLIRKFTANGYFSDEHAKQFDLIKEAFKIQSMSWWIVKNHWDKFGDAIYDHERVTMSFNEAPKMISYMVYNRELYLEMSRFEPHNFNRDHWVYRMPVEILEANHLEKLDYCFLTAQEKLEKILKSAEQNHKIAFLRSRLLQMKKRKLNFSDYWLSEFRDKVESSFSNSFKDFLQDEADYIEATKDIDTSPILTTSDNREYTFESAFGTVKGQFILDMLENLSITIDKVPATKKGTLAAIWGVGLALKDNMMAPPITEFLVYKLIADKIGVKIKGELNSTTNRARDYRKQANSFIKANYTSFS